MKQIAFMVLATAYGILGVFTVGPIAPITVYYLFAVLRPQYLWEWALPGGVAWSQYVAVAAIVGAVGHRFGLLPFGQISYERSPPLAASHKAYLLFGAWACVAYVTAQVRQVAWPLLLEYFKIFAMFFASSLALTAVRHVWRLYLVSAAMLVYLAYEINILYLLEGRIDVYHRGYGGLDNNGAGLMLAMGVPLVIFAWEGLRRWWRWVFAAAVPVLVHAVLMTYSRGAMVALLTATPLLLLRTRRRRQFAALAVLLAFAVPVMAGPEIRARFFTLREYDNDESANSRFASWKAAIDIANDYPIFGAGLRNSNLLSYRYGADIEGRTIHSQYLQILADTGYVGLGLYLLAVGSLLRGTVRARQRLKERTDESAEQTRCMLAGVETSIAVFCVGGAFLSVEVFELPYLLALLGGQLTLLAAVPSASFEERGPVHLKKGTEGASLASGITSHRSEAQEWPIEGANTASRPFRTKRIRT